MINLVRVVQNDKKHLIPENYKFCPRYNHDNVKLKCVIDENCKCSGVDNSSIIKKIKNNTFILQCNYWCD